MAKQPPGPSFFSTLGEIYDNRLDLLSDLRDLYGDIVKVPAIKPIYLVNHPEALEQIMKSNIQNYKKGGLSMLAVKKALGNSLVMKEGEEWKKIRKLIAPYFQPKHIQNFIPVIYQHTHTQLKQWHAEQNVFDILPDIMSLVFRIALEVLYCNQITTEKLTEIIQAISLMNKYAGQILVHYALTPLGHRYRKAKKLIHHFIDNMIQERINSDKKKEDVLALLLSYKPQKAAIFDEVKTFLMTGHETVGVSVAWTVYLLARYPEVQYKVQQEIHNYWEKEQIPHMDQINQLSYTHQVFAEALRLYPPIWLTGRIAQHEDTLNDYLIQAKSEIFICPFTMHRHPTYWAHPDNFIPERHCPEEAKKRHRFSYIPFGGGPRACIAGQFATMEAIIIIGLLLQHFTLELHMATPPTMEHLISLKPREGIKIKLKPSR